MKRFNIRALHKDRLTDRHEIFIVASHHHYKPEKQYTSGLAENSRWRPEMNAKTLKTQCIGDRLTDRREILTVA